MIQTKEKLCKQWFCAYSESLTYVARSWYTGTGEQLHLGSQFTMISGNLISSGGRDDDGSWGVCAPRGRRLVG